MLVVELQPRRHSDEMVGGLVASPTSTLACALEWWASPCFGQAYYSESTSHTNILRKWVPRE